ncbi:hypothetical protein AB0C76_08785 [Kitasatospora sp. NPDC048722]|uniref:hypothetical protein n=1 Tax=Kitasatospora sp. NPDC048722 TaxID=3155639 RepID=UPI00340F4C5B
MTARRFTIVRAANTAYPTWVIYSHRTRRLVRALPPRPEPLRFYSYDRALTWVHRNETP